MRWYVYVYYDEDGIPFYVGKGCGMRAYKSRKVPVPPRDRIRLQYFEEEEQAFAHEINLIAFWGRREFEEQGLLMNCALGGPGKPGVPITDKMRAAHVHLKKGPAANAIRSSKEYWVKPPGGEEFKIKNLSQFSRDNGLQQPCMSAVANKKSKQHKGWTCRHA